MKAFLIYLEANPILEEKGSPKNKFENEKKN